MNKIEYAKYLASLVPNFDLDIESENIEEEFYYYFQCFMPDGKNVEKIFEPLENGRELFERLKPIYDITKEEVSRQMEEGNVPAYFCPIATNDTSTLSDLGRQHIENLKIFAQFIEDSEIEEMLNVVDEVVISEGEVEEVENDLQEFLYDAISDWAIENEMEDELISLLSEAYYSIDCDYYLAYYLQYPSFKEKPKEDFLRSYFQIWKNGYHCKLDNHKLIIFKR